MRLWTRKEAYIKADGRGMSLDLKRIDVLSLPDRLRLSGKHPLRWRLCRPWTVRDLDLGPGVGAALVAEGSDWQVAHFDWPSDPR
jgi:4'-phosphopantetheinyl transferase